MIINLVAIYTCLMGPVTQMHAEARICKRSTNMPLQGQMHA